MPTWMFWLVIAIGLAGSIAITVAFALRGDGNSVAETGAARPGTMTMVIGFFLLGAGIVACMWSFNMDTSVRTSIDTRALGLPGMERVNNLGLLQKQMMTLMVGLAVALAGFVAILVGGLKRDLAALIIAACAPS